MQDYSDPRQAVYDAVSAHCNDIKLSIDDCAKVGEMIGLAFSAMPDISAGMVIAKARKLADALARGGEHIFRIHVGGTVEVREPTVGAIYRCESEYPNWEHRYLGGGLFEIDDQEWLQLGGPGGARLMGSYKLSEDELEEVRS